MRTSLHVLLVSALALGACTAPEEGRLYGVSTSSTVAQRDALLGCRDQLGFAGVQLGIDTNVRVKRYEENIYRLRAVPSGPITAGDAARINACAEQSLEATYGSGRPMVRATTPGANAVEMGTAGTGRPAPSIAASPEVRAYPAAQPVATRTASAAPSPGCRPDSPVLYGGTAYCPGR